MVRTAISCSVALDETCIKDQVATYREVKPKTMSTSNRLFYKLLLKTYMITLLPVLFVKI